MYRIYHIFLLLIASSPLTMFVSFSLQNHLTYSYLTSILPPFHLHHSNPPPQKILRKTIRLHSRIMQIQSMTRHLSQIRSSPARSRIQCRKNGFSKIHRKRTISITKRKIIRAVHDRDGFSVIHCRSSGSGEGEEFSKSGGAFGGFGEVENGWVEAGSAEEADLGRDGAGGDEVVGWDGGEAVGGVVGGEGEVEGEEEGGDGGAVAGETGEDCGVYLRDWLVFSSC